MAVLVPMPRLLENSQDTESRSGVAEASPARGESATTQESASGDRVRSDATALAPGDASTESNRFDMAPATASDPAPPSPPVAPADDRASIVTTPTSADMPPSAAPRDVVAQDNGPATVTDDVRSVPAPGAGGQGQANGHDNANSGGGQGQANGHDNANSGGGQGQANGHDNANSGGGQGQANGHDNANSGGGQGQANGHDNANSGGGQGQANGHDNANSGGGQGQANGHEPDVGTGLAARQQATHRAHRQRSAASRRSHGLKGVRVGHRHKVGEPSFASRAAATGPARGCRIVPPRCVRRESLN